MKLEGLHKGKSRAINLDADARKKSSRETFRGGSGSLEDDGNRRRRSNLFHGLSRTNSADKPHLCQRLEDNAVPAESVPAEWQRYARSLSAITSRNIRRLSRKKLTLLPSAWFQRTGISRIRNPACCAR